MISKQRIKFVKSLKLKKYRQKATLFVVEGAKNVNELLRSDFVIRDLYATARYLTAHQDLIQGQVSCIECSENDLVSMGSFQSNAYVLAVAEMKSHTSNLHNEQMLLALDGVQDPGNLGTIIRLADWYGIRHIIASPCSADFYNPKVLSASMGSFVRVVVHYTELTDFLSKNTGFCVYGTFLQGKNIHHIKPKLPAIIVMGSEAKGIGKELTAMIAERITIPRFGNAESLNVAVSTAIVCDNFARHLKDR
jgi:TrmH family RNA methyltransferase